MKELTHISNDVIKIILVIVKKASRGSQSAMELINRKLSSRSTLNINIPPHFDRRDQLINSVLSSLFSALVFQDDKKVFTNPLQPTLSCHPNLLLAHEYLTDSSALLVGSADVFIQAGEVLGRLSGGSQDNLTDQESESEVVGGSRAVKSLLRV